MTNARPSAPAKRPSAISFLPPFSLAGETALITGGGTGLGLGMARCLVAAGAEVVLVGRRSAELEAACVELGSAAHALPGDICDLPSIPALAADAARHAGPISILVNNAGTHLKKPALDTTDAEFSAVLQTHLCGAFALSREVGRQMATQGKGNMIFIASMASFMGIPLVAAYAAAKSGYLGMVRTLAAELGPRGVRVNAIAPGWIESAMMLKAMNGDPSRKAKVLGRTALGRWGQSDDIGWAAVYLASPASAFVTGTILTVDGGAAMGF